MFGDGPGDGRCDFEILQHCSPHTTRSRKMQNGDQQRCDHCCIARRQILKKIVDTKTSMGEVLRSAAFAQTEARYSAGEFKYTVFDNVDKASVRVRITRRFS